jgi:hypothetical protein
MVRFQDCYERFGVITGTECGERIGTVGLSGDPILVFMRDLDDGAWWLGFLWGLPGALLRRMEFGGRFRLHFSLFKG